MLNSSTVTKSRVVPGAGELVRILYLDLYSILLFSLYFLDLYNKLFKNDDFPVLVDPTTYTFGLYYLDCIYLFHLSNISRTLSIPVSFLAEERATCHTMSSLNLFSSYLFTHIYNLSTVKPLGRASILFATTIT